MLSLFIICYYFCSQETRLSAESIWENTRHLLDEHETPNNVRMIYIATDEKDKNFFGPFKQGYEVRFLEHYYEEANLSELNQNHIGMIEQIVCANAHTFIGTPRSTFTGYIHDISFTFPTNAYSFLLLINASFFIIIIIIIIII